jgi:hypothetical protein
VIRLTTDGSLATSAHATSLTQVQLQGASHPDTTIFANVLTSYPLRRSAPRVVASASSHREIRREVSIMRIQHWQDAGSLLLGVWLVLSPFALAFAGAEVWITIALGLCVILFAVEGFVIPSYLEEWGEILIGLALVGCTLDDRLRFMGHGKQCGLRHIGDLACSLGTDDRSRFQHLVARSLASPGQLRKVVT